MSCFCDYDAPAFYHSAEVTARKEHRCEECSVLIQPGERYERVNGMWDGSVGTFKTCTRCLDLRRFVVAHVPCTCWAHGNIREDVIETAREWSREAPGLLFGALRREVAIRRARQQGTST